MDCVLDEGCARLEPRFVHGPSGRGCSTAFDGRGPQLEPSVGCGRQRAVFPEQSRRPARALARARRAGVRQRNRPGRAGHSPYRIRQLSQDGPGGTIVYSDVRAESNVSVLSFDAATATIGGPPQPVTTGTRFWLPPHPSPDGQWLALAQAAISDPEDIFAVERDGTRFRHLTNDAYHDRDPQVSPNGELVAFASDRGGRWGLWVISADGGHLRPLTAPTEAHDWTRPHWSPDGAFVAAWEEPGHRTVIFDASRTSSAPQNVVLPLPGGPSESSSIDADHRAWSADGRRLALRSGDLLAIYSLDSRTYRTAAIDGGILGWIPSSSQLLLSQRGPGDSCSWTRTRGKRPS